MLTNRYDYKSNLALGVGFKDIDEKSSLSSFAPFLFDIKAILKNYEGRL